MIVIECYRNHELIQTNKCTSPTDGIKLPDFVQALQSKSSVKENVHLQMC